jgi:hypothetical protein
MAGSNTLGSNCQQGYDCGHAGVYGTRGLPAAGNLPGGRSVSSAWIDHGGNLWLFGGTGYDGNGTFGTLNDLWKYQPANAIQVPAATPAFSVTPGTYTAIQTVSISDSTSGATVYYTTDGTTPTTNSTAYTVPITVSQTETISAIAVATGYSQSVVATAMYTINLPPPPSFTISGTSVTVVPGATTSNTSTITVTPSGGFTGSVALTAAITTSPNGAQHLPIFSFGTTSPVSIVGTTTGTATLTITTTTASGRP